MWVAFVRVDVLNGVSAVGQDAFEPDAVFVGILQVVGDALLGVNVVEILHGDLGFKG